MFTGRVRSEIPPSLVRLIFIILVYLRIKTNPFHVLYNVES